MQNSGDRRCGNFRALEPPKAQHKWYRSAALVPNPRIDSSSGRCDFKTYMVVAQPVVLAFPRPSTRGGSKLEAPAAGSLRRHPSPSNLHSAASRSARRTSCKTSRPSTSYERAGQGNRSVSGEGKSVALRFPFTERPPRASWSPWRPAAGAGRIRFSELLAAMPAAEELKKRVAHDRQQAMHSPR